jgi:hypothetical protein
MASGRVPKMRRIFQNFNLANLILAHQQAIAEYTPGPKRPPLQFGPSGLETRQ